MSQERVMLAADHVPVPLTTFVGRTEELRKAADLLARTRLLTLTGVGGCGKTRLAVETLRRAAATTGARPERVCWVDLGAESDPGAVSRVVAAALGAIVDADGDPAEAIISHIDGDAVLLCLDTCEHVLGAVSTLVEAVLPACPEARVLATSREPLGVAGETIWRIPSLTRPDAEHLFVVRAEQASVPVPSEQLGPVREICRRLDGIPLAIELTAAWVRVLAPAQIAASLDERFESLVAGRAAVPRQQTLSASMKWSHDRLDAAERAVFRRMGVFAGTFTLAAIEEVCAFDHPSDPLHLVGRLIDTSLLHRAESGDEARFTLLDTVRHYARELLAGSEDEDAVRDRHLAHFLSVAETAEAGLDTDQDRWRVFLDSHWPNIREALEWGLAGDGERVAHARRIAAAMARYWFIRGLGHRGLPYLDRAIAAGKDGDRVQARLLAGAATVSMVSGRRHAAADLVTRALPAADESGDAVARARAIVMHGFHQFFVDFSRCQALCREARDVAVEAGDTFTRDWSLVIEAYSVNTRDRHPEAVEIARLAEERALPRGDRYAASLAHAVDMWKCLYEADLDRALTLAEEALEIARPLGDYFNVGTITSNLAYVMGWRGDLDGALRVMDPIVRGLQDPDADTVGFTVTVGQLYLWRGDIRQALEWSEMGIRLLAPHVDGWTAARQMPLLVHALRLSDRLDEARRQAERGVAIAREYGARWVLSRMLTQQARLAVDHDLARAWKLQHEALAVARARNLRLLYFECLDSLADIAYRGGAADEAAHLLAACGAARATAGHPYPPVDVPDRDRLIAGLETSLRDAFTSQWQAGAALSLDEAVAMVTRGRGARGRPASGWASLTPTELDVVRLVVDGLTNPAIADRLVISRATVKTHLSHIYAKVGVANRAELAAQASARPEPDGGRAQP